MKKSATRVDLEAGNISYLFQKLLTIYGVGDSLIYCGFNGMIWERREVGDVGYKG